MILGVVGELKSKASLRTSQVTPRWSGWSEKAGEPGTAIRSGRPQTPGKNLFQSPQASFELLNKISRCIVILGLCHSLLLVFNAVRSRRLRHTGFTPLPAIRTSKELAGANDRLGFDERRPARKSGYFWASSSPPLVGCPSVRPWLGQSYPPNPCEAERHPGRFCVAEAQPSCVACRPKAKNGVRTFLLLIIEYEEICCLNYVDAPVHTVCLW